MSTRCPATGLHRHPDKRTANADKAVKNRSGSMNGARAHRFDCPSCGGQHVVPVPITELRKAKPRYATRVFGGKVAA